MERGYVHVYTGNGKGKTTSAIGLMVRAVGAGKKVYFGQFMKDGDYSEIKALKERFPEITLEQYGGGLVLAEPGEADIRKAAEGLEKALAAVVSKKYDMAVIDEINVAAFLKLIPIEGILNIIESKPAELELVLTGRYADNSIIEKADLVSEIKEVKHCYSVGVPARIGIEM